jgi:hypothetical protein
MYEMKASFFEELKGHGAGRGEEDGRRDSKGKGAKGKAGDRRGVRAKTVS